MNLLSGSILLPANTPVCTAATIRIEIRDVSRLDAPSVVVTQQQLHAVALRPNESIPFRLQLSQRIVINALALRVHISINGDFQPQTGDLLTTSRYPITPTSISLPIQVTVQVI